MRNQPTPIRPPRSGRGAPLTGPLSSRRPQGRGRVDILEQLSSRVIGQGHAMEQIVPYVRMHRAGLSPEGRPVGVFLLLGPTGIGKTKTVEALADVLHGSEKSMLRVDCGEFQMEHEVAKLIGAPPGYLGHRETQPIVTQQRLNAVTSESSNLSLVLFDEIEKAAPSMTRLLLGVLDKAVLRLGDNTQVNFERSLIFLTSNLGAEAMRKLLSPDFGFESVAGQTDQDAARSRLATVGRNAVRRRFSPEFVNRIDAVITYHPLDRDSMDLILEQQFRLLQRHVRERLQEDAFTLKLDEQAREFLLDLGTSQEFGARELKRTLLRKLTQPLAALVEQGVIPSEAVVRIGRGEAEDLTFEIAENIAEYDDDNGDEMLDSEKGPDADDIDEFAEE